MPGGVGGARVSLASTRFDAAAGGSGPTCLPPPPTRHSEVGKAGHMGKDPRFIDAREGAEGL